MCYGWAPTSCCICPRRRLTSSSMRRSRWRGVSARLIRLPLLTASSTVCVRRMLSQRRTPVVHPDEGIIVFRALFDKLKAGLSKTRDVFSGIASLFRLRGKVDRDFLNELEKRLFLADVGTSATTEIVEKVRQAFLDKEITGDVEAFVKQQLKDLITAEGRALNWNPTGPTVVLVAGVNGSGKTTSIAKLARLCQEDGKKVLVAACDTFRAAAVEQLTIWTERLGCEIIKNQPGSDPAAVAHDACERATARGY